MRNPNALPAQLRGRVFTRAEAQAWGVGDQRLRARDIERLAHATYRHTPLGAPAAWAVEHVDPEPTRWGFLRALTRRTSKVWASHITAAEVYGLPLPHRVRRQAKTHLTAINQCFDAAIDPAVVLHRAQQPPAGLATVHGVRLAPLGRVFVEASTNLSVTEQVCLADQMVRVPRQEFEGRRRPLITPEELSRAVADQRRRPGIVQARRALELVRVGADSPPETLLRLALISAGLPEPQLQIRLDPDDPYSPVGDAGYRTQRIVLQYDGAHHFTSEQQAHDQRRNAEFEADGWAVVIANREDLRENFRRVTRRLATLLAARS